MSVVSCPQRIPREKDDNKNNKLYYQTKKLNLIYINGWLKFEAIHMYMYLVFLDMVNQFKSSLHHTWRSKIYIQHLLGEGDRHHNIFHLEVNKNSLPEFFFLPQKWQLRVH